MSRNIAYFFHSCNYPETRALVCLKSLRKHNSTCIIKLLVYGLEQSKIDYLRNRFNAQIIELPKGEWDKDINPVKIKKIKDLGISYGDNVLVLDVDLFFRGDPFELFKKDFDVFVSSRYYRSPYAVESGVWGFKYNERSERFLDFYTAQIYNSTWLPYLEWKKQYNRGDGDRWWTDQDFLCTFLLQYQIEHDGKITTPWSGNEELQRVFLRSKIPFEVKLIDNSFRYDYTTPYNLSQKDLFEHIFEKIYFGDQGVKVIHLRHILHEEEWLKRLGLTEDPPSGWVFTFLYYSGKYFIKQALRMFKAAIKFLLERTNPKVSIIIATYNKVLLLKEAIDSALRQSYSNIEIIVCDDGSTDNTESLCRKYEKKYPKKFKYINGNHIGIPAIVRNRGIREMQGEYFCYLDHDDLLTKNSIGKRLDFFDKKENHGIGMVFSDYQEFKIEKTSFGKFLDKNENKKLKKFLPESSIVKIKHLLKRYCPFQEKKVEFKTEYHKASQERISVLTQEKFEKKTILNMLKQDTFFRGGTFLMRKEVINSAGGFDEKFLCRDGDDLFVRIVKRFKIAYIDEVLYLVRHHSGRLARLTMEKEWSLIQASIDQDN